jgi:hypothetical protein
VIPITPFVDTFFAVPQENRMTIARIAAVVAVLAAFPAFATVKHTTKKHAPAKKSHVAAAKKTSAKKKTTDSAIASAPRDEAKSEDSTRLAQADTSARDNTAENRGGDDDVSPSGNRRVITHSTAAPQSDVAE